MAGGGAVGALHDALELWEHMAEPEVIDRAVGLFCPRRSERNAKLIVMQRPDATDVEGFQDWRDRGRKVKPRPDDVEKGAWAIRIVQPAGKYPDRGEAAGPAPDAKGVQAGDGGGTGDGDGKGKKGRQRYKVAYVFDITQTVPLDEDTPASPPAAVGRLVSEAL